MIIYTWQQIEGIKENIMIIKVSERGRRRLIISQTIPLTITEKNRTTVHNESVRKIQRLLNKLSKKIKKHYRSYNRYFYEIYTCGSNAKTNSIIDKN